MSWSGHEIKRLSLGIRYLFDVKLAPYGLSEAQGRVLYTLHKRSGLSQRELQDLLGVRAATLTNLITALEDKGYVERRASKRDKRVRRLYLTARAKQFMGTLEAVRQEIIEAVEANFSAGELEQFNRFLERLQTNITKAPRH